MNKLVQASTQQHSISILILSNHVCTRTTLFYNLYTWVSSALTFLSVRLEMSVKNTIIIYNAL